MVEMVPDGNLVFAEQRFRQRARRPSSRVANNLSKWGTQSFWIATAVALSVLALGAIYAGSLSNEGLWRRFTIGVVLGLVPCIVVFVVGCVAFWVLKGASRIYDPIAAELALVCRAFAAWFQRISLPARSAAKRQAGWFGGRMLAGVRLSRLAGGRLGVRMTRGAMAMLGCGQALMVAAGTAVWHTGPVLRAAAAGAFRGCVAGVNAIRFALAVATFPLRRGTRAILSLAQPARNPSSADATVGPA